MSISHIKSNTIGDFTGTVTVFNSLGSTVTAAATDLVRPSDWNSAHNMFYALGGNTAGSASISGTDVAWYGGNNVTLSADTANSRIIISGANTVAQTNQTVASGNIAGTGFTSTTTAGTAVVGTLNTAGLSLGVPQYLTTYVAQTTQTQPAGNIAGVGTTFAGTNVSGSMTLNSNGLNLALSAGAGGGGADGYNILAVNAGATQLSSTYTLSNGNNVSFGIAAGVITATASYSQSTQSALKGLGVSNTGNTAGNTGISTGIDYVLAGSGSITLSQSTAAGGPNTAWIQHPAWITTAMASNAGSNFMGTNTALTANGVSMTANSSGLSLNFPAFLTTAAQSSASNVSGVLAATNNAAGGTATLSGNVSFSAANGLTFYTSAGNAIVGSYTVPTQTNQTVGLYAGGNTTGQSSSSTFDARSISFSGAGIASVGYSAGSVIVSVPAGGGGGDGVNIVSMGSSGNTSGTAWSSLSASVGLYASGALYVTQNNSNQIVFVDNDGWKLFGNTAGTSSTAFGSADQIYLSGGNNITLSGSSNSIVISAGAGGGGVTGSWWQPEVWGSQVSTSLSNGTLYLRPFELDAAYDCDMLMLQQFISSTLSNTMSFSASVSAGNASSGTGTWGQTMTALWFSRVNTNETNASYNSIISFDSKTYSLGQGYSASVSWSTNASSATASVTTSWAVSYINNIDGAGGVTTSSTGTTGSTSFSSTSTNANSFSSSFALSAPYPHISGTRPIWFPQAGSNASGGEYWLGLIQSTATGSTNMSLQRPLLVGSQGLVVFTGSTNNSYLEYGNSANLTTSNYRLGFGSYSASSQTTAQIPLSQVSIMGSNASIWFAIVGKTK